MKTGSRVVDAISKKKIYANIKRKNTKKRKYLLSWSSQQPHRELSKRLEILQMKEGRTIARKCHEFINVMKMNGSRDIEDLNFSHLGSAEYLTLQQPKYWYCNSTNKDMMSKNIHSILNSINIEFIRERVDIL